MGAHLNAYTSREQTVYYAKAFSKDLPRGMTWSEELNKPILRLREDHSDGSVNRPGCSAVEVNYEISVELRRGKKKAG